MRNHPDNIPVFWETKASSKGVYLHANPRSELLNSTFEQEPKPYDLKNHERESHSPVPLFSAQEYPQVLVEQKDCLDLVLRLSGQEKYALPEEWVTLFPIIQRIIDIEHTNNPAWQSYNTYLTVQYSKDIKAGVQQRNPGAHTDGLQSARRDGIALPARNYVLVTNGGTIFYPQTFVANLDLNIFNIFQGFDLQIKLDENGEKQHSVAGEMILHYLDPYTVHESGLADRDGDRLFFRLTWEELRFDRAINTHNNMLSYNWPAYLGDKRRDLITPTLDDIESARSIPL